MAKTTPVDIAIDIDDNGDGEKVDLPPPKIKTSIGNVLTAVQEAQSASITSGGDGIITHDQDPKKSLFNWIRYHALLVISHPHFDAFIMGMILISCVFMLLDNPSNTSTQYREDIQPIAEMVFSIIFLLEMSIKMTALGLCYKEDNVWDGYFADPWNLLDFVVVLEGLVTIFASSHLDVSTGIKGLRALRVLRPLRTIQRLPGLKILVEALLRSIPLMAGTIGIAMFYYLIFGIVGMQLWRGSLRNRCIVDNVTPITIEPTDANGDRLCGVRQCLTANTTCTDFGQNPNYGVTSFDNILYSYLNIFIFSFLEGHTTCMHYLFDASGTWVWIYFLLLVIFCSLILMNLTIAVIIGKFRDAHAEVEAKTKAKDLWKGVQSKTKHAIAFIATAKNASAKRSKSFKLRMRIKKYRPKEAVRGSIFLGNVNTLMRGGGGRGGKGEGGRGGEDKIGSNNDTEDSDSDDVSEDENVEICMPQGRMFSLGRAFLDHSFFNRFIYATILVNAIVLGLPYHGAPADYLISLQVVNSVCTWIFIVEMALKVSFHGPAAYIKDAFNVFDSALVFISIAEMLLLSVNSGLTAFRLIRIVRLFRVLRVMKLARYLSSLQVIITVVGRSLSSFGYVALLLLLFMFIFTILGIQLFGGKYGPTVFPTKPRANFDSPGSALLTIFQLMSGEDWNNVLYDATHATSLSYSLFFVLWVFIGNSVLLNLFLAVLLDNFSSLRAEEKVATMKKEIKHRKQLAKEEARLARKVGRKTLLAFRDIFEESNKGAKKKSPKSKQSQKALQRSERSSYVRTLARTCITDPRFDRSILCIIVLSSIALALDSPKASATILQMLFVLEILFAIIFSIEMIIKIVALSIKSYLSVSWNVLDCIATVGSIINLASTGSGLAWIRIIRLLRALRPLRMISRFPGLRLVVNTLLGSMGSIANVILVLLIVWFMFAVLGVSLFAGKNFHCNDPLFPPNTHRDGVLTTSSNGSTTFAVKPCNASVYFVDNNLHRVPRAWVNQPTTFDSLPEAMLTLFIMCSLEGWPTIMYHVMDQTEVNYSPHRDSNGWASLYFVFFVIAGSFFFLSLFVGVIYDEFNRIKEKQAGVFLLTWDQRRWVEQQKELLVYTTEERNELKLPQSKWRKKLRNHFADAKWFDNFILYCITLNVLFMCLTWEGEPIWWRDFNENLNLVFVFIFTMEAVIKICGLGVATYFQSNWNTFDFSIAFGSWVDVAISIFNVSVFRVIRAGGIVLTRILRLVRVARAGKVIKSVAGIRRLVKSIAMSMPAIGNIGSLLFLLFFIYSVLAISMFGEVQFTSDDYVLNDSTNFQDFPNAMLALFRCAVGEGWHDIMFILTEKSTGITKGLTPWFFVVFILSFKFVLLNMFIMVIVDNFQMSKATDAVMTEEQLGKFVKTWHRIDITSKDYIPIKKLINFLRILEPPLGPPCSATVKDILELLSSLDLPNRDGRVHFKDILLSLHRRSFASEISPEILNEISAPVAPTRMKKAISSRIERKSNAKKLRKRIQKRLSGTFKLRKKTEDVEKDTVENVFTVVEQVSLHLLAKHLSERLRQRKKHEKPIGTGTSKLLDSDTSEASGTDARISGARGANEASVCSSDRTEPTVDNEQEQNTATI